MRATLLRRYLGVTAGLTGVVVVASWVAPAVGHAAPAADWVVAARASAVDMGAVTTGGFIVDHFDPSAALATSRLETSAQQATSLASAPYPSEIGQQFPGLFYGVLQNTLPYNGIPVPALSEAPAWPFTVRSSANGSDPAKASAGGDASPFALKTESRDRSTVAQARSGGSAPGAFALFHSQAATAADASGPTGAAAKAVSSVDTVAIGDVLRIGHIRTELELTGQPGAKPGVVVRREVSGASVAGVATDIRPAGLFLHGTDEPLPQPARDALKAAGLDVRIGERHDSDGGVTASGLVIRRLFDFSEMSGGNLPLSVPKTMTLEMAFGVVSGNVTEVGAASESAMPPYRLAAATTPATGAAHKEMGRLGWLAEGAAIAVVLLLVIGRARRVVGRS